jgi:hypothetical protein
LTYPLGKFYANIWNILEGNPGVSLGLFKPMVGFDWYLNQEEAIRRAGEREM